ncbi:winged helix DNA-binding domain-containing protein [Streptomyces sp. NBC_00063]|uniref:winged helix DNA-binding domain-containing protein n=1 Tax=Streptomyces sp. NBC_00063 TaxID=2975638 RepID=UPI002250F04B|nr:winged helix DNA-binding domain-containing protein [Streptomyces sp. NBC_00063]MCX5441065.1 winged helix DNA-binding domain-containing protein [Streptomyces sp. NBC_00063]
MPTRTVSWSGANARRIERQGLAAPAPASPNAIPLLAGVMLGAHAQVLSAAELSLGLRIEGATRADVRRALWEERSLVKTYGPRGTVHLLAAGDVPMWTGALSAIPGRVGQLSKDIRLTAAQTDAVVGAAGEALSGAELTADELTEAIVARTGSWAGDLVLPAFQGMWPRWRQAMHTAAHRGVLAFGPNRGQKVTYTNPGAVPMEQNAALFELVRRYLYAYGPATSQHFAKWLAAPRGWASALFEELARGGEVEEVDFEGVGEAWVAAEDSEFPGAGEQAEGVRLLPYFDAFGIASQPRELLFPGRAAERALAGGQAGNYPLLLVDGTVAGVWHQRRSGKRIAVTVEPLERLTAGQLKELELQTARVGDVAEGAVELTVGKVTVGPHA